MDKSCYYYITRCSNLMRVQKRYVFMCENRKWEYIIIVHMISENIKNPYSMVKKLRKTRIKYS